MRHALAVLLALLLAACGNTPRPFEHDSSNELLYRAKSEKVEVTIETPANMPQQMAERLAAALAIELQSYGIVAGLQPAQAPKKIAGAMSTRDAGSGSGIEIEIEWFLLGPGGADGPAVSRTNARTQDYASADDHLVSRIAQQAAPRIATLMGKPPAFEARAPGQVAAGITVPEAAPPDLQTASSAPGGKPGEKPEARPAAPPAPVVKVMVAPVTGAPSDGNQQLFSGMRRALGSNRVVVIDKPGDNTFIVTGTVTLKPIDDRLTQLSVKWVVKDPKGTEIGSLDQTNPVPIAATKGSWAGFGDIVATAAVEGVLELLEKALNKGR
jgi:uncharacterized lipoprotein YmbA